MTHSFTGTTELTAEEIARFSHRASPVNRLIWAVVLIAVFTWAIGPVEMGNAINAVVTSLRAALARGDQVPEGFWADAMPTLIGAGVLVTILFALMCWLVWIGLRPVLFQNAWLEKQAAKRSGKVHYQIDAQGLHYEHLDTRRKTSGKLSWQKFTDAELIDDVIVLRHSGKMRAFIPLRAFGDDRGAVLEFVRTAVAQP